MISWVSFLVADERLKQWERERTHTTELSYPSLFGVSIGVGVINTVTTLPFDMVKTQLQKADCMTQASIWETMRKIVATHGLRGLYSGWRVRIAQYMVQSVLTVSLLEKLEQSWNK